MSSARARFHHSSSWTGARAVARSVERGATSRANSLTSPPLGTHSIIWIMFRRKRRLETIASSSQGIPGGQILIDGGNSTTTTHERAPPGRSGHRVRGFRTSGGIWLHSRRVLPHDRASERAFSVCDRSSSTLAPTMAIPLGRRSRTQVDEPQRHRIGIFGVFRDTRSCPRRRLTLDLHQVAAVWITARVRSWLTSLPARVRQGERSRGRFVLCR